MSESREIGRFRDGVFIRARTTRPVVRPGAERQTFLMEAARVLGVGVDSLDLDAPILARYGADELDLYECVQYAEDVWAVQLTPTRMTTREFEAALKPFGTLRAIVSAAEAAARAR